MSKYKGFNTVELRKPQRSYFDLSHEKRITAQMGVLTPICVTECLPSDSFTINVEALVRVAPLLAPIYDMIQVFVHLFFVPNRLLWDEWETFITGGRLGVGIDPVNAPIPPYVDIDTVHDQSAIFWEKGSLADYLGCPLFYDIQPLGNFGGCSVDVMPFIAYQLIWYEYYRDRNFVDDEGAAVPSFPYSSGEVTGSANILNTMNLRIRNWSHDYFTSALPFTQRGEEVLMPLVGSGTVTYMETSKVYTSNGSYAADSTVIGTDTNITDGDLHVNKADAESDGFTGRIENIDEVFITNSSVSINDFRAAYALQVWLERNAVAGSRYVESNQAHFAVRPQDFRLQRPEYIGGMRIPIKISEVVSTAYSSDGEGLVPLANLAGHGITYGAGKPVRYFCAEHGFIMGIMSIMNKPSYHQGLPRMFRRRTFLSYPWPTFAKLGEQQVDKAEIYADVDNLTEDEAGNLPMFGYQSRYADWKNINNTNHGDFHDTLLFWTLTRDFETSPELSEEFNQYPVGAEERIFAVQDGSHKFWMYVHNKMGVKRPLPYFGTPNTLGFS